MPGKTHEQTFNTALGEVLKKIIRPFESYQRAVRVEETGALAGKNAHKRIDILIEHENYNPIAVETAFDGPGADKDALARIEAKSKVKEGGREILSSIAVQIPKEYQTMDSAEIRNSLLNEEGRLFYALYQRYRNNIRRWPSSGFLGGGVHDLTNFSFTGAIPKEHTEIVAEKVADYVRQSASLLSSLPEKRQQSLSELIGHQTLLQRLETIALLWLNACFVQYQLGKQQRGKQGASEIPALPLVDEINPGELVANWRIILKRNWHSIFDSAVKALNEVSRFDDRIAKDAIASLIEAVRYMDIEHLGLHINIGAELFPKISRDRKTAAAFYTQPATTELLARLTVREKDLKASDWAADDLFEKHSLTDLACGTGTLLRAGYRRIEYLYKKHAKDIKLETMHRKGMDWAWSVLISVPSPPILPHSRTRGGQSVFDLTGTNEQERKKCQAKWGRLIKKLHTGEHVNRKAGMAATFLLLAKRKVKPGGRIGFVLPLTAAFASTWAPTRKMLHQNFADLMAIAVVSGQASGKNSLPADTGMEEMLLVATRREGLPSSRPIPVHCVSLLSAFSRVGEATEIAKAIENSLEGLEDTRPIKIGDEEIGHVALFHGGLKEPWNLLGTNHSELALVAQALCKGKLSRLVDKAIPIAIEMGTIQSLFEVGPTHDLIGHPHGGDGRGAFEFHEIKNEADAIGGDRSLWKADSQAQKCLIVQPTHKGVAHQESSSEQRDTMRKKQSSLFYARNMRWTSQAVLAATTNRPVHGGSTWTALLHKEATIQKMFALWANSTFGLVIHWTQGQRTQLGRATTQIEALKKIPCPRFDSLADDVLAKAAKIFDDLENEKLLPACQAHDDDTRKTIDKGVIQLLNLGPKANNFISDLRKLWCREPSVHGNNKAALKKLS